MIDVEPASAEDPHLFVDLALPMAVPRALTYAVPSALAHTVCVGQCALAPLGPRRLLTGLITRVYECAAKMPYAIRPILDILTSDPVVHERQLRLYHWMAGYYMCTLGDVIHAALPAAFRPTGELMARLAPNFDVSKALPPLSRTELALMGRLAEGPMSYAEAARLLGKPTPYSSLQSLSSRGAIRAFAQVREKGRPRIYKHVRLSKSWSLPAQQEQLMDRMKGKPARLQVLLDYWSMTSNLTSGEGVRKSLLTHHGKRAAPLNALINAGIFEELEQAASRLDLPSPAETPSSLLLSNTQRAARDQIVQLFETHQSVLLHGVTGGGKTEIYIDLIQKTIRDGRQALLLIPEIGLTTQIVSRLRRALGSVAVYHSRSSATERMETWQGVLSGKCRFVVGARSAVFLPFESLGLIVVDEEHDPSYKQQDPAPRYHARDVALVMGRRYAAKTLLGSATPSAESYYRALQNQYGLVELTHRFGDASLPKVVLLDTRLTRRRRQADKFSPRLIDHIAAVLNRQEQVLIFQNRRGYAPVVSCEDCGWRPACPRCSVSLIYHKADRGAHCHYCGYRIDLPPCCPSCSSTRLVASGYGVERLEEELKTLFEGVEIRRMDRDTTRSLAGYQSIIEDMESAKTQLLVGTQMVAKGFDFGRVTLAVVFDADAMMRFPHFRAHERAFQLMMQAVGRSGRRDKAGLALIQTANPQDTLLDYVRRQDTKGFIVSQLQDRKDYAYPPYNRLIEITVRDARKSICHAVAAQLAERLRSAYPQVDVMGPAEPLISRLNNQFLYALMVKIAPGSPSLSEVKHDLLQAADLLVKSPPYRSASIAFDVDPQ